jgi:transcriptional regulator with XRE-family HTH domain
VPDRQTPDPTKSPFGYYALRMRRERKKAGLKQEDVARHVTVSPQLYGHYENCRRVPTLEVSEGLDGLYRLDEFFAGLYPLVVEELRELPDFLKYTEEEARAAFLRMYHPFFMPGLVQIEDYALKVLETDLHGAQLEEALATRMKRQEILQRDEPPWLFVLLTEAAIDNMVGSPDIMRAQLTRLLELNAQPRFSVQVVPYGAPVYKSGAFTLLDFPEGGRLGYVDAVAGFERMIVVPEQVGKLAVAWEQIKAVASRVRDSEDLIRRKLEAL